MSRQTITRQTVRAYYERWNRKMLRMEDFGYLVEDFGSSDESTAERDKISHSRPYKFKANETSIKACIEHLLIKEKYIFHRSKPKCGVIENCYGIKQFYEWNPKSKTLDLALYDAESFRKNNQEKLIKSKLTASSEKICPDQYCRWNSVAGRFELLPDKKYTSHENSNSDTVLKRYNKESEEEENSRNAYYPSDGTENSIDERDSDSASTSGYERDEESSPSDDNSELN